MATQFSAEKRRISPMATLSWVRTVFSSIVRRGARIDGRGVSICSMTGFSSMVALRRASSNFAFSESVCRRGVAAVEADRVGGASFVAGPPSAPECTCLLGRPRRRGGALAGRMSARPLVRFRHWARRIPGRCFRSFPSFRLSHSLKTARAVFARLHF